MQTNNTSDPTAPNPAACFLQRCLRSGMLSQEALEWNQVQFGNTVPFARRFKQLDAISNTMTELQQKSLDVKLLELQHNTADITHPKCLAERYKCLQLMNNHLEKIVQEKMMLKQRLVKPVHRQCLPVEANCHKHVSELPSRMIQVIEDLSPNLQLIKSIPLLSQKVRIMEDLMKMMASEILKLKEVMEFIVKWREQQKNMNLEYLDRKD
ncbi:HAUS augmin-like complex subunit 2 [Mobula hypostoma]|uniref:HAUS augmin-like complex subunit 2 n=1 Tax=Mobula hypostoma TaxID=723540 RepID=UPI002FC2D652